MRTIKISNGFVKDWTVRQIKDFNRATGLRIKPLDSIKEMSELSDIYCDTSVMRYTHSRGTTFHNDRFVLNINDNGTTSIFSKGKGYVGVSKCHINDAYNYNYWLGIAVAWAHYKNERLPEFSVRVKNLKIGDKFKYNNGIYELLAINTYIKSARKYLCVLVATTGVTIRVVGDVIYLEGKEEVIISNI